MFLSLTERLTFDRLFRISEPKRVYRSFTVRGPPLEIDSYQDAVYYIFNFKANPSTTGLRHRGYVKFFKPKSKNPKNVPLQHLECLVDCTCPDFRYRWAWANKQRQSSVVGPNSLNQAWNKAPRKTNPSGRPGLCKHILATRSYLYGLLSSFPGDEPDTAYKLDRLTKYATKRWTDFEGQMRAAKAKEAEIRRRREMRNLGQRPAAPPALPAPVRRGPQPASVDAPTRTPADRKAQATTDLKKAKPEPLPLAVPPGQRGRTMPTASPTATKPLPPGAAGKQGETPPAASPTAKPKRVLGNRMVNPLNPGAYGWIRPQEAGLCAPLRNLILESVVSVNGAFMSNIKEAIKLVAEMEADELDRFNSEASPAETELGAGMDVDIGGETLEPSEPPVSDAAIGADTEGDTALSLLRSMKNSLEQIATAVAPVEALPDEGGAEGMPPGAAGGGGPIEVGGGEEFPAPDEPPSDFDAEDSEEFGDDDGDADGDADGADDEKTKKKAED